MEREGLILLMHVDREVGGATIRGAEAQTNRHGEKAGSLVQLLRLRDLHGCHLGLLIPEVRDLVLRETGSEDPLVEELAEVATGRLLDGLYQVIRVGGLVRV